MMRYIIISGLAALWFFVDKTIQTLIACTIEDDLRSGWHFSKEFLVDEVQETKNCGYIMRIVWGLGMVSICVLSYLYF